MIYDLLLFLHIIGACVLLGTGAGIAFFMVVSHRSQQPGLIAHTAGIVVLADMVFTASAVVVQPVTGVLLALEGEWSLLDGWLLLAIFLYLGVGIFWLPVVWIQIQLRRLAEAAHAQNAPLPGRYHQLFRIWFLCGFPAFFGVLAIVWLMLTKPAL